jgi:hypothetical protein
LSERLNREEEEELNAKSQRRKDAKGRGEGRREEGNAKVQRRKDAKGIQKKN